jgi:signal transduction histidine kinase
MDTSRSFAELAVRLPLRRQILLPLLAIVALTLIGVSSAHVWLTSRLLRSAVDEQMRGVARTLNASTYPLETNVLRQVSGLSGAELVLVDEKSGAPLAASDDAFREAKLPASAAPAQAAEHVGMQQIATVGEHAYFYGVALLDRRASGGGRQLLRLFYPERTFQEARWQAIYPSLLVGAVALVFAIGLSSVVAARVTQPVQLLKRQTEQIAAGDFAVVEPPERDDELRDLALAVNRMAALLKSNADALRQHERTATLHQMGAGIAHQLRNAATGCRMAIDLARRQTPALAQDENLIIATRQLELMENYLQRFLTLGRTAQLEKRAIDLRDVIAGAARLVKPRAEHLHVTLAVPRGTEAAIVSADAKSLEQVLVNLLTNAIEACSVPEVTSPEVRIEMTRERDVWHVVVTDNGPGFDEQVRTRLGEPFVTTKPEGTGLGLAVAKEILAQHDGQLTWSTRAGWTRFEVALPRGS